MDQDRELTLFHLRGGKFKIGKGLAKAISEEEIRAEFYQWAKTANRSYDTALEERIISPLTRGLLLVRKPDGSIKFDDRKVRYAGHQIRAGGDVFLIGPTHFGEVQNIDIKSMNDESFAKNMRQIGMREFGDSSAYFANMLAVNAVPRTQEGYVHVFKRSEKAELYPSHWHVIGGCLDTQLDYFQNPNPTAAFMDGVTSVITKEYSEETALKEGEFSLELTGLSMKRQPPTTVDFNYIARIHLSSQEFLDRMQQADESSDHTAVYILRDEGNLEVFLRSTEKIVPTGRGSLENYLRRLRE